MSGKQAQKVLWVLRLIEEFDSVPSQYLKKLVNTDDIWEVRVQLGNNAFRLLGFFDNDNLIILTNGFAKKTQKTPSQQIDLQDLRTNYVFPSLRRKEAISKSCFLVTSA